MKKKKFVIDFDGHQDYAIFNITSSQPDFRIAYLLNKHLGLQLQRDENMLVKKSSNSDPQQFSFFSYTRDMRTTYYLIHDLSDQEPLIKNFFLLIHGFLIELEQNELVTTINKIPEILSVNQLNLIDKQSIRKSQNKTTELLNLILTELEYHILTIAKQKNETKIQLKQTDRERNKRLRSE